LKTYNENFIILKNAIFLFVCIGVLVNGQKFSDYRARYDNFDENDGRAMEFVNSYIKEAGKTKNYRELSQAYRDAVYFNKDKKLAYADSTIWAASLSKDTDIIGNAYLTKGSVFYFSLRKYQFALDEYLKAWKYLKNSENSYLHYKNLYYIGIVKYYLGYYEEALDIFSACKLYYSQTHSSKLLPNLYHNQKRGYLNSLNHMSACLIFLARYKEASDLIIEGLKESANDKNFDLERSYFYELRAVLSYIKNNNKEAEEDFNTAIAGILKADDFTHASVIYFLKGKILLRKNKDHEAVYYFKKVDSIFIEHDFVLPAVRESYELLINYYKDNNDSSNELYYTKQLLAFDKILSNDFKYLSTKIHKEYDTKDLSESKRRLENLSLYGYLIAVFLILTITCGVKYYNMRRKRHDEIVSTVIKHSKKAHDSIETTQPLTSKLPQDFVNEILNKLSQMEEKRFYLEKGLTQNQLAKKLKTNTTYLSAIINMSKGCNFSSYINRLRIEYAKEMLINDNEWRKYSIDTISKECGFSNRSNFSKFFLEITSLSPVEFIQKIKGDQE